MHSTPLAAAAAARSTANSSNFDYNYAASGEMGCITFSRTPNVIRVIWTAATFTASKTYVSL
jgi:hypothetical protein